MSLRGRVHRTQTVDITGSQQTITPVLQDINSYTECDIIANVDFVIGDAEDTLDATYPLISAGTIYTRRNGGAFDLLGNGSGKATIIEYYL